MFKIGLFSAFMLVLGSAHAACALQPSEIIGERFIGSFTVDKISIGGIQFSEKTGDITKGKSGFNLDTLYEARNSTNTARFRFADDYFRDGASTLGSMQWENEKPLADTGNYNFYALETKNNTPGKTITIVGDSITWWSSGKNLRCLLSQRVSGVSFVGPHTDPYGYGHAGEGGNKTVDVLKRIDKIKKSDLYLLHIGTNDWPIGNAKFTFDNIKKISEALSKKGGTVLVMTILPRLDENDKRNQQVNQLVRAWNGKSCNCKIVELEKPFRKVENIKGMYWDAGLHPNITGYGVIADILAPNIAAAAAGKEISLIVSGDTATPR